MIYTRMGCCFPKPIAYEYEPRILYIQPIQPPAPIFHPLPSAPPAQAYPFNPLPSAPPAPLYDTYLPSMVVMRD